MWLAVSRPSAANRAESPHSSQWWEAREFSELQQRAQRLRKAGDIAALEQHYREAIPRARALGVIPAELTYLTGLANTYVLQYRYAEAIETFRKARVLAESVGDWEAAGAVAPGMSSVYLMSGDEDSALEALKQGVDAVSRLARPPYYEAAIRLQQARLGRLGPEAIYRAIQVIWDGHDPARLREMGALEAVGWDLLADEYRAQGKLQHAEGALGMALRLRQRLGSGGLFASYWRLAGLRLAQAEVAVPPDRQRWLDSAERFNQLARDVATKLEQPILRHQHGLIERARGRMGPALAELRAGVEAVERWRSAVPLAASSLEAADHAIHEEVLRSFVETAADESLRTGDRGLARDSFLAVELHRSASLRHVRELAPVWREKLPARYWSALAELRRTEASQIRSSVPNPAAERLRLEITEMESYAGIGISLNPRENFFDQTSLILFQRGLGGRELLLSFYLGESRSYLWAVSRESLHLYELPPAGVIAGSVAAFRESVLEGRGDRDELGAALGRTLFGQLTGYETAKESWLLSVEDALFELPFAALRAGRAAEGPESGEPEHLPPYLVEQHSLQILPGALLLSGRAGAPGGRYLAVGDPIYNSADVRLRTSGERSRTALGGLELNRLAATGDEVRRTAEAWPGSAEVLSGAAASREAFLAALNGKPAAVHLATHVVQSMTYRDQAFLALSLGADGTPDLLAATDVARLSVPGSLVVMTGCASGTGEIVPGAGLLGLTRGWLAAGASSVVATAWPVPDARGDLIPEFVRYLAQPANSPAEALRRSQIDRIHSATWQADPAYWASFQVTGGAR